MTQDDQDLPSEERDTLPPSGPPSGNPPAGTSALEEIAFHEENVESWAGYDESKFMHRATAAVVNGTNALLKAKQTWDIEGIVKRQAVLFGDTVAEKLAPIADRIEKIERNQGERDEAVEALQLELGALKSQMAGFEQLYARLDRLEHELAQLKLRPSRPEPPHSG